MLRWLAALIVAAGLSLGQSASALGLGEITTRSALNEPMVAQISLLGATQEELSGLEVRLASTETFERYGIDKPGFLSGLKFRIRSGAQPYVEVTSTQPISDPFVTMLVEAVWPRGRLLREYTVLLDPPTFRAPPAAATPAPTVRQAPTRNQSANTGNIRRPSANNTTPAQSTAPVAISGDQYRVQRRDTLWQIAERIQPNDSVTINQVMLAIYQANPDAFDGNINRLNAGAVLQLPSQNSLMSINRSAALEEVRRQNRDWRGAGGGSLTLVAPDEDAGLGTGSASGSAGGSSSAELAEMRRQLAEKENQLRIRNEELARLEAALAARDASSGNETAGSGEPEPEAPVSTADLYTDEAVDADSASGADTLSGTGEEAEIFAEPTGTDVAEADAGETAVEASTPPVKQTPTVVTNRTAQEPSLLEKITGSIYTYIGAGVLAVFGLLVFMARRRSADNDPTGTWESLDSADLEDLDGTLAATGHLREVGSRRGGSTGTHENIALEDPMESTSPVDETSRQEAINATGTMPSLDEDTEESVSMEDTFSSDTAINFDQSDPIAEADFHMAYGLYDQAADLIKGALAVDSDDVKLKAKLCEIYFVWGNQEGFVAAAEDLKNSVSDSDSDWNKVVIMGQQLAPAHALFSGAVANSGDSDLDISLDGETMLAQQLSETDATGGFTDVFTSPVDGTVEQAADISGIDFEFDESAFDDDSAGDASSDSLSDASGIDFQFDGESLDASDGTVEQPIDLGSGPSSADTAEMDLADLDLHTGTGTDIGDDLLEATGMTSVLPDDFKVSLPDDSDATVLASSDSFNLDGLDETGTAEMPVFDKASDSVEATGILSSSGIDEVDMDIADLTAELSADDLGAGDDATMQQPAIDGSSTLFSEQVFGDDSESAGDADSAADTGLNLALEDTGETNIAEVGTKLDLARAYVDMGDPDGARSILEEVLTEGDEGQRAEAKKLLDNLS